MTTATMLKILNPALALLTVTQALSGYLADNLPRDVFEAAHEGGGTVLIVGIVLHVILNRGWIAASFRRRRPAG
ncbi:MAG: hypothetical protein V1809_04360 [Planctomycetota bacterium]